jgi:hypothetical protein
MLDERSNLNNGEKLLTSCLAIMVPEFPTGKIQASIVTFGAINNNGVA